MIVLYFCFAHRLSYRDTPQSVAIVQVWKPRDVYVIMDGAYNATRPLTFSPSRGDTISNKKAEPQYLVNGIAHTGIAGKFVDLSGVNGVAHTGIAGIFVDLSGVGRCLLFLRAKRAQCIWFSSADSYFVVLLRNARTCVRLSVFICRAPPCMLRKRLHSPHSKFLAATPRGVHSQ